MTFSPSHVVSAAAFIVVASVAPAGAQDTSLERSLARAGAQPVYLIDASGHEQQGIFHGIENNEILLRTGNLVRRVPLADVTRVDRYGDRAWDGAIAGAEASLALSVWIWKIEDDCRRSPTCDYDPADHLTARDAGWMTVAFTAIGFGIDLAHRGRSTIWLAPVTTPVPTTGLGRTRPAPADAGVMVGYRHTF